MYVFCLLFSGGLVWFGGVVRLSVILLWYCGVGLFVCLDWCWFGGVDGVIVWANCLFACCGLCYMVLWGGMVVFGIWLLVLSSFNS